MAWFDDLELPGSTVTGHFGFVHEDGPDEDDYPDIRLASGRVRFEPTATAVKAGGAWIGIAPVEAELFEGELVTSEEDLRPPRILSTDADTGVENWGWKATFDIRGANIKPVTFRAPTEGVHLTGDLIPITGLPVEVIGADAMDRLDAAENQIASQGSRLSTVEAVAADTAGGVDTLIGRLADLEGQLEAVGYSSGERDITGSLPGVVSGALHLLRAGSTVWLDFRSLVVEEPPDGWVNFSRLLPPGFRGVRSHQFLPLPALYGSRTEGPVRVSSTGHVLIYNMSGGRAAEGLVSFPTLDAPPSSLPGVPA